MFNCFIILWKEWIMLSRPDSNKNPAREFLAGSFLKFGIHEFPLGREEDAVSIRIFSTSLFSSIFHFFLYGSRISICGGKHDSFAVQLFSIFYWRQGFQGFGIRAKGHRSYSDKFMPVAHLQFATLHSTFQVI